MIDLTKGYFDIDAAENYNLDCYPAGGLSIHTMNMELKITIYEELLAYALLRRAMLRDDTVSNTNQEKIFPYIKRMISWLRTTDFYTSPASMNNHDNYPGGLLDHTLEAYNQLVGLRFVPKFVDVVNHNWYSAVFAILVHDWCKIGRYESYTKRMPPDDDHPDWWRTTAYRPKQDDVVRFGHGTQSLIMAMQLCNSKLTSLTFEEMAAIRWHMDGWDIGHYDDWDLNKCNNKVPMVRMIQFADQLATTTY